MKIFGVRFFALDNFRRPFAINFLLFLTAICVMSGLAGCAKRQTAIPTSQIDVPEKFWVRVLLYKNKQTCNLKIASSFTVIDPDSQFVIADFEKAKEPITLRISEKKLNLADITIDSARVMIVPAAPYIFTIDSDSYRGYLEIITDPNNGSFAVINHVPLEPYLAGVIAAEMPNYWEAAALEAQTVAARTYCLYMKKRFGAKRNWDVKKTQASQVYRGLQVESKQVWSAINETFGQVLTFKGPNGKENIFPTYYSSICGGHTESSQNVFGGEFFKPLAGVECKYCKIIAKREFFFWPKKSFYKKDITKKLVENYPQLKKLGFIEQVLPLRKSEYKDFTRLTMLKLTGSTQKSDTIRAEDFRLTIDPTGTIIKSAGFKIIDNNDILTFASGTGFGHGVGLCQTGAQAMARKRKNAKKILDYYYPDSKIIDIYEQDEF